MQCTLRYGTRPYCRTDSRSAKGNAPYRTRPNADVFVFYLRLGQDGAQVDADRKGVLAWLCCDVAIHVLDGDPPDGARFLASRFAKACGIRDKYKRVYGWVSGCVLELRGCQVAEDNANPHMVVLFAP